MARQQRKTPWLQLAAVVAPIIAFVGGMGLNAFTIADKIATKALVEERIADTRRYADEHMATVLKEAMEHSDMNKQMMALDLEKYSSTVKSMDVKIDYLNIAITNLSKEILARPRK